MRAGDVLGAVPEHRCAQRMVVPPDGRGVAEVMAVHAGHRTLDEPVARLRDAQGRERTPTLARQWPVRRLLPAQLLRERRVEPRYPCEP